MVLTAKLADSLVWQSPWSSGSMGDNDNYLSTIPNPPRPEDGYY